MIGIVDYGVANLGSMINMLRRVGAGPKLVRTAEELLAVDRIILPGIGAFDHGMEQLEVRGLVAPLREAASRNVPLLGVCLGMQLLGEESVEGTRDGLGIVPGRCRRLELPPASRLRVPHMGWSRLTVRRPSPLLDGLDASARFYFVHSYHLVCRNPDHILAEAWFGDTFTAVIEHSRVWGVQFHPEKSHRYGMTVLKNFVEV